MLRRKKKKKSYAFLHIKRAYRRGQGHEPIRRSDSPMRRSRCRLRRRTHERVNSGLEDVRSSSPGGRARRLRKLNSFHRLDFEYTNTGFSSRIRSMKFLEKAKQKF